MADPYDQFDPDHVGELKPADQNPFAKYGDVGSGGSTSATGAFARGAERGALPAAGGLAAFGAGAEVGSAVGAPVAALTGPFAPLTEAGFALGGGLISSFLASTAVSKAQDYALSKLPDTWREAIGQDDRQAKLDEGEHPVASFLGGMTPYALTMRPGAAARAALRENATALQKIMASPVTARVFGGTLMGGIELGQEKAEGGDIDWRKVAISTGFGLVFNKPTRLGERLTEMGARPVRGLLGRPSPTVAQAGDAKVMGPGVTEEVFAGSHKQDPSAEMTAQEAARNEAAVIGPRPVPDVHAAARTSEPELFARWDDLNTQRDALRGWIAETGPGEAPVAQKHLAAVEGELAELSPQIQATYRRVAEATGAQTAEPMSAAQAQAMLLAGGERPAAAPGVPAAPEAPAEPAGPPARPIEEQKAFIADDVARQLMAAGRPEEEARAAGALVAARYETRAARMDGALGSAEDLYRREAAEIRGQGGPGPAAPAAPTVRPLREMLEGGASPEEIAQHPDVIEAQRDNDSRPETQHYQGYGTPEFEANREFNIDGEKVVGYDKAVAALTDKARSYSTKGPVKKERTATLVLGPPAAGKSRLSEKIAAERGAAIVDPDDAKQIMPEYAGGRGTSATHEESAKISSRVLADLLRNGENVVIPRVGGNLNSVRGYVENLAEAGYKVDLVNLTVDPAEAYRRMIRRFMKTGRIIGTAYFSGIGTKPRDNYYVVKGEGKVREAIDVDGNGPPGAQRIIDGGDTDLAAAVGEPRGGNRPPLAGGDQASGAGAQGQDLTAPAPAPIPGPIPNGVQQFSPADLAVDAKRFQFKEGGDESGVTERLKGVKKWDPIKAGMVLVWQDTAGKNFIVDGHQRYGLAKRIAGEDPAQNPQLLARVLRESDGVTDSEARTIAALKNIAEGTGTAVDAAKVLRENPERAGELPPRSELFRQAQGLVNLSDDAFRMVINDVVPANYASIVGRLVPAEPELQSALLGLLAKTEPANTVQAEAIVRQGIEAGLARKEKTSQGSLFGDEDVAESLYLERAKVLDRALKEIKQDKKIFSVLTKEQAQIEKAGNKLAADVNQQRAAADAQALQVLQTLANRKGPVSDALATAATDAKRTGKYRDAVSGFVRELRSLMERHELARLADGLDRGPTHVGDEIKAGVVERAPESVGPAASADVAEFAQAAVDQEKVLFQRRRAPEGVSDLFAQREAEGQMGLPGAERITQNQLAQMRANAPLRPTVAQKGMDVGLFGDDAKQKELFQIRQDRPHGRDLFQIRAFHGSPYDFDRFDTSKIGTGEGHQAFGHGLYFAENKAVADDYKNMRRRQAAWTSPSNDFEHVPEGHLYEVSIDAKPEQFLDSDKPLKDQPAAIREAILSAIEKAPKPGLFARLFETPKFDMYEIRREMASNPEEVGRMVYHAFARLLTEGKEGAAQASRFLQEAGIAGVKYLDRGSREAGAGTYNYVVFDDSKVKITGKDGKPLEGAEREGVIRELHQRQQDQRDLDQSAMGKIRLRDNARPIITLMKTADASTFIHESGHEWLEQLLRDAAHEKAPEDLRQDASTVLNWLGAKSAEDVETRHHEKFARGFEQYLREGVAPSPGLAGVFAKFRDWLLKIYQTIKGLGEEISPDVRSVFDRMLAVEPQRTVIAPERARGPTLPEIHTADAAMTEPHEADAAMARVESESERADNEPPPEIAHEIAAADRARAARTEPRGEAGAGAGEPAEVAGHRAGPEPEPRGGSVGEGPRPVVGGGGEARPPGAAVQPLATQPADLFGARESPFVDKAGNIVVSNLTTREDVAQAIRDAAKDNNDFIGDRRGTVTDGQVMDLAEALGMDAAKLSTRQIGQAFNAEQVMAARKLLVQSATEVAAAMKKALIGTDEDVLAYALAKDRHQMIQAQVAGITAEAGRALRAFRNIAGMEQAQQIGKFIEGATGKTLFQLRREAALGALLETPQQVSKFMQDAQNHSFGRMLMEYWINGLISGPATHTTYMVGNLILALQKAGPETALAAGIGAVRAAMGRPGERVRIGEVGAQIGAAARGLPAAIHAGAEAFRTGVTTLLPSEKGAMQPTLPFQPGSDLAQAAVYKEGATYHDAMAATFGIARGLLDGMRAGGALLLAGGEAGAPMVGARWSTLGAIPDIEVRGVNVLPIGSTFRLPSRFIAAIHSFFRSVNYSMDINARAYRTAAGEGLTGNAMDARIAELRQNPTPQMMEGAATEATELTLMGQGSEFTRRLSAFFNTSIDLPLVGETQILKFIDPFVHISSNIIDQTVIQRTPLGAILSPTLRADLMGANGNIAQDRAMARMLAGTALTLTFGALAAQGFASGSGPKDPKQAAMWRLAGNQAHSVRIGDIWYDVHRLGPMGMLMGIAADLYDVAHTAQQGEYLQAASMLQHAVTQNILDESFMRGPSDLIKAVDDPGRYGESYLRSFASSFIPFSVGMAQMDRASDPYSRQARTVVDAMRAKVPGLSEQLFPRRDIWGEPMVNLDALGMKGLTAIYERQISTDPVNIAMENLGIAPAAVERKIRNVELTDQQYDDFARISGRMTKARLDAIVRSPDWHTWPAAIQANVAQEVIRQSREAARGLMFMKYPGIVTDATAAKMKKFTEEPVPLSARH